MIDTARPLAMYRELKRDRLRDFPTDADLRTIATVWRHGEPVVNVIQGPGEVAAREVVYLTAAFFRAELVVLVADSYHLTYDLSKGDQHPKQGDLAERWASGHRKGITEALVVQAMDRVGEYRMTIQPYRITLTGITWQDAYDVDMVHASGPLIDAMRVGWADSDEWRDKVALAAEAVGVTPGAETEHHADLAVARHIAATFGHAVMLLETGEAFVRVDE